MNNSSTAQHASTGMHAPQGLQTLQPMQNMQNVQGQKSQKGQEGQEGQKMAEQLTPLSEWHDNYEVMEMSTSVLEPCRLSAQMASCRSPKWAGDATTRNRTCNDSWMNRTETAA